jgi:phage FluMu protein gp41
MKTIFTFFFALVVLTLAVHTQEDIQSFQARINELKAKPVAQLTVEDVQFLENVISMNSGKYGEVYQKVVDAQKSIAKNKLKQYDIWLKEKNRSDSLDIELGTEKLKTEAQGEVIEAQSDTIQSQKALIDKLKNDIVQLKNQIRRATRTNNLLKEEKTGLEQIIQDNNEIVARVSTLLSDNIDLRTGVPADIKSELENTECQVAELISQNYILTLEKLKQDKDYLDKLREYYKANKEYPQEFYDYLTDGQKLLLKLRDSDIPCVNLKADEVKSAIDELKSVIQNKDCNFFCQIANYFSNNIWLLGIIVLAIIGLVLLLVVRKK